jgi:hypothetical protein
MPTEITLLPNHKHVENRTGGAELSCVRCGNPRKNPRCSKCNTCLAEYKRNWRKLNPERHKQTYRAWVEKNKDKIKIYSRTNYLRHKERFIKYAKQWAKNNPSKRSRYMIFQNARRRSRVKANGGAGFSAKQWKTLKERFGGICAYCQKSPIESVDHFIPISKGGQDDYRNIVPSCKLCNSTKRQNDPDKWIKMKYGSQRLKTITDKMFK